MVKIIIWILSTSLFCGYASASLPKEDIKFIVGQSIILCEKIEFHGRNSKLDISGDANVALNKIAKLFASASIEGGVNYSTEEYEGFIQSDLLTAYKSSTECRQKFSNQLIEMISGSQKKCENPIYKLGRGEVCGVERYISKASSACGVLEYNSGSSAACGVDQYHRCETGSCGWNSCGFIKKCDAKECRTAVCGVERYKTCKHKDFGVKSYNVCRDESHGVEVYKACRSPEFGIERCAS